METKEVAKTAPQALEKRENGLSAELNSSWKLAGIFSSSGLFSDTKSQAQAMVKIMAGKEMGIGPFSAMRGLNIIQGKVVASAEILASKIKSSGDYDYVPTETTDKRCAIQFTKGGQSVGAPVVFTIEEAAKMGLSGKDNWQKQAGTMLFWRCLSKGARMHCPHLIGGAYLPDEIQDAASNSKVAELNQRLEVAQEPKTDERVVEAPVELEFEEIEEDADA
jgi:hypothetical protein